MLTNSGHHAVPLPQVPVPTGANGCFGGSRHGDPAIEPARNGFWCSTSSKLRANASECRKRFSIDSQGRIVCNGILMLRSSGKLETTFMKRYGQVRMLFVIGGMLVFSAMPSFAQQRYDNYTAAAAKGPHMKVEAATFFGGEGLEEFVAAGELKDGSIVAFGNAVGPEFPKSSGKVITLGIGKHAGLDPFEGAKPDDKRRRNLDFRDDNPDIAGFVVVYDNSVKTVARVIRFDWNIASISAARIKPGSQTAIISGRATSNFTDKSAKPNRTDAGTSTYTYGKVPCTGDVFVAELDLVTGKLLWAHTLAGAGAPPREIWLDDQSRIVVPSAGLFRLSADGTTASRITDRADKPPGRWLGIDPSDGTFLYGGDRNTRTNKQPYRQPFLLRHNGKGEIIERYWEPNPKEIGSDAASLESDSSVRDIAFNKDGAAVVIGWSDGGNSVFPKQVGDWRQADVPNAPLNMAPWGMKNANSLGHIMFVDLKNRKTRMHGWLAGYLPGNFVEVRSRNAPNHLSLTQMELLADESIAVTGAAATGLIQTPNALYKYPEDGPKYGGEFVTVLDANLSQMLFSSYVPGCSELRLAALKAGGLVVVGRSRGTDMSQNSNGPTASPTTASAHQKKFGGNSDGNLFVLSPP